MRFVRTDIERTDKLAIRCVFGTLPKCTCLLFSALNLQLTMFLGQLCMLPCIHCPVNVTAGFQTFDPFETAQPGLKPVQFMRSQKVGHAISWRAQSKIYSLYEKWIKSAMHLTAFFCTRQLPPTHGPSSIYNEWFCTHLSLLFWLIHVISATS